MCTGCKKKQRSTKKFWIRRLPNVLCLHLKRFKWVTSFRQKLETYIEFPLTNLDMNKYILDMVSNRHFDRKVLRKSWIVILLTGHVYLEKNYSGFLSFLKLISSNFCLFVGCIKICVGTNHVAVEICGNK